MIVYDFLHDGGKYEEQLYRDKLVVDFYDLYSFDPEYALKLIDDPENIIDKIQCEYDPSKEKPVEVINLVDSIKLRGIGTEHLGTLVQIEGIITSVSIPDSRMTEAAFTCNICGETTTVTQEIGKLVKPDKCQYHDCQNRKFRDESIDLIKSKYIDFQILSLQEAQDELPSGEIPEPIEIHLYGHLVRSVSPGHHVKVVGVVKLRERKPKSIDYIRLINTVSITSYNNNPEEIELTPDEVKQILEISQHENLEQLMIDSYAPSIYGWGHIKQALLYSQFGGLRVEKGNLFTRGDVNVLLAGDPGIAKSQMLYYTAKLSVRGHMATAGGASAVGLTAALVKIDERYVVSAGALVLADKGIACIDEVDKMHSDDRAKIHQAMEQQIVKIDKGGLHLTLNARCAIVAACNPTSSNYDIEKTLPENVKDLPDSFLTRFDLAFIMLDRADEDFDEGMANLVLGLDGGETKEMIPFDLLKKYIIYAKQIKPKATVEAKTRIRDYYIEKRQQKKDKGGLKITPRQLEGIMRMAQARARLHLRDEIALSDVDVVIKLLDISVNEVYTDPSTGEIDYGIAHNVPSSKRNQAERMRVVVEFIMQETGNVEYVKMKELERWLVKNWNIDVLRARDVVKLAIKMDIITSPFIDRVML